MRADRWVVGMLFLFGVSGPNTALAQEKADPAEKQKKAVEEVHKKLDLNTKVIETDNLLVGGSMSDEKRKPIADMVQKYYAYTLKTLKFDKDTPPPGGKLAVYVFPERAKYTAFFRLNERSVERGENSHAEPGGETPYIAVTYPLGTTTGPIDTDAGAAVARLLLMHRSAVNATVPHWMRQGFAKAIQMRVEPMKATDDRTAIRKMLLGPPKTPPKVPPKDPPKTYSLKDAWADEDTPEKKLLAASLVEYLTFGPEAAKFPRLLEGFRVSEGNPNPNFDSALKFAEIAGDKLEAGWKRWVITGK